MGQTEFTMSISYFPKTADRLISIIVKRIKGSGFLVLKNNIVMNQQYRFSSILDWDIEYFPRPDAFYCFKPAIKTPRVCIFTSGE